MHTARSVFSLAHLEIAIPGRQCVREQPDEIIRRRPKAVVSNPFRSVVRNSQNIASVRNQGRKTRQKALPLGTQLLGRRVRQKRMSRIGTEARGRANSASARAVGPRLALCTLAALAAKNEHRDR